MTSLVRRLSAILFKRRHERELDDELRSHIELAAEDYEARGLSPDEALRRARFDLGSVEVAKELHRENRGLPQLESVVRDVTLAARSLRRDLGMTVFAVLIVGFGIAAATTVYSVVSALILRPLPFEDPERLVWIANGESTNLSAQTVQVGNLLDFRERASSFEDVVGFFAFYGAGDVRLGGTSEPERVTGVSVTVDFFDVLGVSPVVGRGFMVEDLNLIEGGGSPVLLSNALWQSRFGGDPDVAGSSVVLDGRHRDILGVLPESFDFSAIFTPGKPADLFDLYALDEENDRWGNTLALIGRLEENASLESAQVEATAVAERIAVEHGDDRRNVFEPRLHGLHERVSGSVRTPVVFLGGAVGILMLIVCANLSNLLLVRAQSRSREMSVHAALGAGRGRLIRRLVFESLMLSLFGATLGAGIAWVAVRALAQISGTSVPLLRYVSVDTGVLVFVALMAVCTGLVFGLAPALQASAASQARALAESGRSLVAGRRGGRLRRVLVVAEIALAGMLLVGVGLMLRSFLAVTGAEPGFTVENRLTLRVDPPRGSYTGEQRVQYFEQLLERVRALPGVESVGLTDALPLGDNFGWRTWNAALPGDDGRDVFPLIRLVDDGYLRTMDLKLVDGRFFERTDAGRDEVRVAVVNETLAESLWPGERAVGRMLVSSGREVLVVGVVRDARYFDLERASGPELYFALRQVTPSNTVDLVVATIGPTAAVEASLRSALAEVAPDLPVQDFRTMAQLVERSTFARRAVVWMISGFAAFGLVLAALGVFGVISYSVEQRRREMGVRLAFGATSSVLRRDIVLELLRPGMLGAFVGLVGAAVLAQALESQLYGVTPADPVTYVVSTAVLLLAAAVAAYLPARRTSRLDVAETLRAD